MICYPVIDGLVVFLSILDILVDLLGVVRLGWLVPCACNSSKATGRYDGRIKLLTHVDSNSEAVRVELLSSFDIDITSSGGRGGVEARMVRSQLATVC